MKEKHINVLYVCDNKDNYKPTLFAVDGKATRDMISSAILRYDNELGDNQEIFNENVDNLLKGQVATFGDVEFFFEVTTLYY